MLSRHTIFFFSLERLTLPKFEIAILSQISFSVSFFLVLLVNLSFSIVRYKWVAKNKESYERFQRCIKFLSCDISF